MKHKLTKYELLGSLAYPVVIVIWAAWKYWGTVQIFGSISPQYFQQWGYIIAAAACGVLPIIFTLVLQIDTSEQFLPRLLIFVSTVAVTSLAKQYIDYKTMFTAKPVMLLISLVFSGLFFYKARPVKFSAWLIIFLANPTLADFFTYLTQLKDINLLVERYNLTFL